MKIGIGITVFNRNETFYKSFEQLKKYAPKGSKIVVVDDGSTIPIKDATYRFQKNLGAPTAKNKCLELLDDCEHIFLFDDDVLIKKKGWEKPYINSTEPHLNYTFAYDWFEFENHKVCNHPNGCMMYFHKSAIEKVGGFDEDFIKYGYWHGSMSCRIYNAGLTSFPFMDVIGSDNYFTSLDENKKVQSATLNKGKYLAKNKKRYQEKNESSEFIPYKKETDFKVWYSNPYSTEKNIGKAYNEFCDIVPNENDWIVLQDGDICFLTPKWGQQIKETIKLYGEEFDLITCLTNRLARNIQRYKGEFSENHDMKHHALIAKELEDNHWCEIEDITKSKKVAGLLMIFKKSLWNKVKFNENDPAFDDTFSKELIKRGCKFGLMKGLYVQHAYRILSENPIGDRSHLLK